MKNFATYTIDDFATDQLFIKWVQHPDDAELCNFWNVWLNNNPHRQDEIAVARDLVTNISNQYTSLNDPETHSLWDRIRRSIHLSDIMLPTAPATTTTNVGALPLVLLLLLMSIMIYQIFK
jgi:hypothetical protein